MSAALKYTLCFCLFQDKVLLVKRRKTPNLGLWNGLGGKIESGETAWDNVRRELREEANLDLELDAQTTFAGIVTWSMVQSGWKSFMSGSKEGMYVYLAQMNSDFAPHSGEQETPEGPIAWQPLDWASDPQNIAVVSNIPVLLSQFLQHRDKPQQLHFEYTADGVMNSHRAAFMGP